jgi:integrase
LAPDQPRQVAHAPKRRPLANSTSRVWNAQQLAAFLAGTTHEFCRPDGAPTHPQLLSDAFQKLVHRSGLPRLRFHDLRHTHATLLLKAGVPIKVVSERLGHSTPGFTMATYQHVIPGMQEAAAATFADILEACTLLPGGGMARCP